MKSHVVVNNFKTDRLCYKNPHKKPRKTKLGDSYVIEMTKLSEAIVQCPAITIWLELSDFEGILMGENIVS